MFSRKTLRSVEVEDCGKRCFSDSLLQLRLGGRGPGPLSFSKTFDQECIVDGKASGQVETFAVAGKCDAVNSAAGKIGKLTRGAAVDRLDPNVRGLVVMD